MISKLFVTMLFSFHVFTAFTQSTDHEKPGTSYSYSDDSFSEPRIKSMIIIQGAMTKFYRDQDGSFGPSISLGIKYLNKFGIAANIQSTGLENGRIYHLPVSMELSFTGEKHAIRPFANLQIGHVFSRSGYSSTAGDLKISSNTKGTEFFSPGIGMLLPVKNQSGILLTFSYVSSGSKTTTVITNPAGIITSTYKSGASGYRVGIGYKF